MRIGATSAPRRRRGPARTGCRLRSAALEEEQAEEVPRVARGARGRRVGDDVRSERLGSARVRAKRSHRSTAKAWACCLTNVIENQVLSK